MNHQNQDDTGEEQGDLKDMQEQLKALEAEIQAALKTVQDNWAAVVNDVSEVPVTPYKKDVS
jgi:flagellar motility protein MotE (MotC chaperone)